MARQQEIKSLLRDVAPVFRSIALEAQKDADELAKTDWAKAYIGREASLNQIMGTARWRMAGDRIVHRQGELPTGLELSTTYEEQNQGRYYLRAPKLGIVVTIRRKPHKKDDEPELLQLQIEAALEHAPVSYGDEIVVYLVVGAIGTEPQFDVVNRGEVVDSYPLNGLIEEIEAEKPDRQSPPQSIAGNRLPEPKVSSAFESERAQEDASSSEN